MTTTIREPLPAEADAVADLHVATWREAYGHLLPADFFTPQFIASRRRMWQQLTRQRAEGRVVRIAVDADDGVVGLALSGSSPQDEHGPVPRARCLYSLYIPRSRYGSGLGQELLDAVLVTDPAMLWVARDNPRAIGFYRRNGFELDGVEQTDAVAGITDVRMVR